MIWPAKAVVRVPNEGMLCGSTYYAALNILKAHSLVILLLERVSFCEAFQLIM